MNLYEVESYLSTDWVISTGVVRTASMCGQNKTERSMCGPFLDIAISKYEFNTILGAGILGLLPYPPRRYSSSTLESSLLKNAPYRHVFSLTTEPSGLFASWLVFPRELLIVQYIFCSSLLLPPLSSEQGGQCDVSEIARLEDVTLATQS